jgi:hypothetical protein
MATIRRMISRLRYVNDELVRAHEAMALPTRPPQPRPHAGARDGSAATPAGGGGVPPRQQASSAAAAKGDEPAA